VVTEARYTGGHRLEKSNPKHFLDSAEHEHVGRSVNHRHVRVVAIGKNHQPVA
jgi:hypothetical protein